MVQGRYTVRPELAELHARAEIEDLLARYGFLADCGAVDAWLDLFCDDAYMDVPDYSGGGDAETVRLSGREELRAQIVEAPPVKAMRGRMQHHMCGPRTVAVHGDVAQVDSYAVVFIMAEPAGEGGPAAVTPSLSFNRWFLRRLDGTWKIAGCVRRRVEQSAPLLREIAERAPGVGRAAPGTSGRPGVRRVNHVAISVSDLAVSISFYTGQLGLEVVATQPAIESIDGMATVVGYPADELKGSWALLAAGVDRVELVAYHSPAGRAAGAPRQPADHGLAHVALQVDDVDGMYDRLVGAGVETVSAPVTLGRHRAFYAYGPDGELIEILEEDASMSPPAVLEVGWTGSAT
jgi:catechol 2,3-dioxygenase-like lactoylglutathione lyase family enzyme